MVSFRTSDTLLLGQSLSRSVASGWLGGVTGGVASSLEAVLAAASDGGPAGLAQCLGEGSADDVVDQR